MVFRSTNKSAFSRAISYVYLYFCFILSILDVLFRGSIRILREKERKKASTQYLLRKKCFPHSTHILAALTERKGEKGESFLATQSLLNSITEVTLPSIVFKRSLPGVFPEGKWCWHSWDILSTPSGIILLLSLLSFFYYYQRSNTFLLLLLSS